MSTPEYREGKLQEEIDRLARLCEAKDAELKVVQESEKCWIANAKNLQVGYNELDSRLRLMTEDRDSESRWASEYKQQLTDAQAQIAMQAELFKDFANNFDCDEDAHKNGMAARS